MDKIALRSSTLTIREAMSAGEVSTRSEKVFKQFTQSFSEKLLQTIQTIAIYYPIRNEVDTSAFFIHFKKLKKFVCYPRTENGKMHFHKVAESFELRTGGFGIAEPDPNAHEEISKPDLIIVPGVCFSENGDRIGYGAGYYDTFLAQNRQITTVGICYDFQLKPAWDKKPHDHPMQMICTESQFIIPKK